MNRFISSILTLLFLGLVMLPNRVVAWGSEGHAVVGEIAERYLTPVTREKVRAILEGRKLSNFEVAMWPDIIRGDKEYEKIYPGNGRWHYVEFDVFKRYNDEFELKLPEDGQDIVSQIRRWRKELLKKNTPPQRQKDAVRFLVHFLGDVHQPLHCAYRYGDMGGNMIPVNSFQGRHYSFDAGAPMDYAPNLHSMWDEYLVEELLAGAKPKTFANRRVDEITDEQVARWTSGDPLNWAVDSYWKARKQAYHWSNGDNLPFKWARPGMDLTSENYIDSKLPVVREQLMKAGVRLAFVLNTALDPGDAEILTE